jgi:hypothetical protein
MTRKPANGTTVNREYQVASLRTCPTGEIPKAQLPRRWWLLAPIVVLNLGLSLYANSWGAPDRWHPDEMDSIAAGMASHGTLNPHFFTYGGWHYYVLAVGRRVAGRTLQRRV